MIRTLRLSWLVSVVASLALAGEGKWTPQQVQQLGAAWVKQQGFTIPLDEKLLSNAVQLPGCSGSFVSKQGLLITNHHCIVSILQEHSTPQQNLVKDGYLARTSADEKASKSYRIQVPRRFLDVTKDVLDALPPPTPSPQGASSPNLDDLQRYKSVEATQKKLVADCEKKPNTRCTFAAFDGGLFFTLTEFLELTDVRLVFAPPSSVGDYGGEIDNWMWPRHSGDFALVRAYQDGKPFEPGAFFPLSTQGVKENDAVAILGYPGVSFRAQLADEMAEREARWYPNVRALTAEWQAIIEEEGKRSPDALIATADDLRSILNTKKNAEGQLAGFARGKILEKQRAAEEKVKVFAAKKVEFAPALEAHAGLTALNTERIQTWDRDFLLDWTGRGARALQWPLLVSRRSVEAQRPDVEREPGWQERDLPRLRERHERDQKRYHPAVDQRLFVSWVKRALALPKDQRIAAVDAVFGAAKDDAAIVKKCSELAAASKLFDLETRKKAFDETPAQLTARADPLLNFALALDTERRALRDRREMQSGRVLRLRPVWRRAVIAEAGKLVAPDANSTLRVTFGRVRGYSPKEAVQMAATTSLAGALAKHTGEEPFDLPKKIVDAAAGKGVVPAKVPVDFLADCDTTGGNSGSPVIDAKGKLVGVNFDRVWENVANDFGYNPEVARNVSADVRYLLWILTTVEDAKPLVAELTAAK
ncbi:MAG: S46 family peptidase [Archangium sp.]|nr:S46 family peptidase [Archangium sp.]